MALRSLTSGLLSRNHILPFVLPLKTTPATTLAAVTAFVPTRSFSITQQNYAKRLVVEETEGLTTISAEYIESPFADKLVKTGKEGEPVCPLCALNLYIRHTDVMILSQFMREDGCVLPRRITGLCGKQQKRISLLIAMSQKAGLMPNLAPSWSKRDPKLRSRSKRYNRYFDEATLDNPRRK